MKKIISLCLVLALSLSFAACGKKNNESENLPAEESLSGINAEVTKTESTKGAEYSFKGYFTTTVPETVLASDISINRDSTLFNFYDGITLFDVSFAERYTSLNEIMQVVEEMASIGDAKKVNTIKIGDVSFYGVSIPEYGMTRYLGLVNGYDVTFSVYTDLDHDAVKAFIKNTKFTIE